MLRRGSRDSIIGWACFVLPAATLLVAGCGGGDPTAPPTVHYGQDICAFCGMIVSDERFTAALVIEGPDGGIKKPVYDDLGCLLEHEAELANDAVHARYATSAMTAEWIPFAEARFVHSPSLQTPMASGAAAAADDAEAQALLDAYGGTKLDAEALRRRHAEGGLVVDPD